METTVSAHVETPEVVSAEPGAREDARLLGLLQDLIARDGREVVARRFEVSERTLRRALSTGQLSKRLTEALERESSGSAEVQLGLLRRQVKELESRLAELEQSRGEQARGNGAEELQQQVEGLQGRLQDVEQQLAQVVAAVTELRESQRPTAHPGVAESSRPYIPNRIYPTLVELEPQPDDDQVYGSQAFTLITEWRQQHAEFKAHWPSVEGYVAEVRMVELELELISEYELTMPPADLPWQDWQRKRELQQRHARLDEARHKLRRKRIRRVIVRLLTRGSSRPNGTPACAAQRDTRTTSVPAAMSHKQRRRTSQTHQSAATTTIRP